MPLPTKASSIRSREAFVETGFSTWSTALKAFKNHEKSDFHQAASSGISNMTKKTSVLQKVSQQKSLEMQAARVALKKIFHTVQVLAQEGIPFRGHDDSNSKLMTILRMRAEDVPELKAWLKRDSQMKWLHHVNIEEILDLMLKAVLNEILTKIRSATCFSILMDECSDVSRLEQVSIVLRHVADDLVVHEDFMGFYETKNARSETLFKIIQDTLIRFNLPIQRVVGQCFDGAANMSGELTGLKTRLLEVNPKALFVHCVAHRLNLAVQDSLTNITEVSDFIGTVKELITFVRDSPQRLAIFGDLQEAEASLKNQSLPSLSKYCPTRWCVRIKSLQNVKKNYAILLDFFDTIKRTPGLDTSQISKAHGFLSRMESFSFYFYLFTLISVFEKIENLNKALQAKALNFRESSMKIEVVKNLVLESRNHFPQIWKDVCSETEKLELLEPVLPRIRKAPRRYDSDSSPHVFSVEEFYRKKFSEIVDSVTVALNDRFDDTSQSFLKKLETFVINKDLDRTQNATVATEIITFYRDEFGCEGIDAERLILHRDMMLDLLKDKCTINSIHDVLLYFQDNLPALDILPAVKTLLIIFLTLPVSTCTCERSFSAMRRLKTYLRSQLTARNLNRCSVLHVHKDLTAALNLDELMNAWITASPQRSSTFAIVNECT